MEDFTLPTLAPHLKLARAPDADGAPFWTLHHPVSNSYFKIDWVAFECLARFPFHKSAAALKEAVERETTLSITLEQIADIVSFLQKNGLVILRDQRVSFRPRPAQSFWKKLLHTYLYVTVPLFRPQAFLEKTYPGVAFLFTHAFVFSMLSFLALMIVWTLPRIDEFFHTFNQFFSLEGVAATLLTLGFVKIVHEFAHAYAAVRYGVKVPHMGVAFIVLYPVLYTETTGSWALSSRRARFHIAVAGITAELCLAAIFLALWHVFPAGSLGQTACFLVVCVSLVGSLLVNLNPLMRFDGYYMLADATGFDNLQSRSIACARYRLREFLFGLGDPPPEQLLPEKRRFLTGFGAALLVYRFFLFIGIAVLVYHLFFQPLGFFLMAVEVTWFILLPIFVELKIWWEKRAQILSRRRSFFPALCLGAILLAFVLPWKSSISLPAVAHAGEYQSFFAPAPAKILDVSAKDGQAVSKGETLATLESPDLEYRYKKARRTLEMLENLRRRAQADPMAIPDPALSDAALEKARVDVAALAAQKEKLIIIAPFDGIVRDFNKDVQAGRYIAVDEKMFVLVNPESGTVVSAYATEDGRDKIDAGKTASFVSKDRKTALSMLTVANAEDTGALTVDWLELASPYGGPVAADRDAGGGIVPRRALYTVRTAPVSEALPVVRTGHLKVETSRESLFIIFIKWLAGLAQSQSLLG
jgi:putative peptide zinc metalloprotease protein